MNQLIVKNVDCYGDETATITLKSEFASIDIFCHLCDFKNGDKVEDLLDVLDVDFKSAYLNDWPESLIQEKSTMWIQKQGPYEYIGCGKVIDFESGIINVLGFHINFDQKLYSDWVEFKISRLELW